MREITPAIFGGSWAYMETGEGRWVASRNKDQPFAESQQGNGFLQQVKENESCQLNEPGVRFLPRASRKEHSPTGYYKQKQREHDILDICNIRGSSQKLQCIYYGLSILPLLSHGKANAYIPGARGEKKRHSKFWLLCVFPSVPLFLTQLICSKSMPIMDTL